MCTPRLVTGLATLVVAICATMCWVSVGFAEEAEETALQRFAKKLLTALESRSADSLMSLVATDIRCYDGSSYEVVERKLGDVFEKASSLEAELVSSSQVDSTTYEMKTRWEIALDGGKEHSIGLYFYATERGEGYEITDITDIGDEIEKGTFLNVLRSYAEYERETFDDFPGFAYADSSDEDLVKLREAFELEQVAGDGEELSKIINLMRWAHNVVEYDGNSGNPSPRNTLNIVRTCREEGRGVNCRMMATILNEAYLAMGFKSRFVTCMPADEKDSECHVTNIVYSEGLGKWVYMDPSLEAYFIGEDGVLLGIADVRERMIRGDSLQVSDGLNVNGEPYGGGAERYIRYMAKNVFKFSCPRQSRFDCESQDSPDYVTLNPRNHSSASSPAIQPRGSGSVTYNMSNPEVYWAKPSSCANSE